jgi:transcriptional regulator with XRE-family HTH domain
MLSLRESIYSHWRAVKNPGATMQRTTGDLMTLDFPQRLAALRHDKNLTQQALADAIGLHVTQLRRYEAGTSQPTLDVLRKLAVALSVSADLLLFDRDERGPDDDLRFQFEALSRLDPEDKAVVKSVLEGLLLKHEAKRLMAAR